MLGVHLWPLYLIMAGSALGGLFLALMPLGKTRRWLRTRGDEDPAKRAKRPGMTSSAMEVLGGITLLSVAVAAGSLLVAVSSYRAFSEKTLCARVSAVPHNSLPNTMLLTYVPVLDGQEQPAQSYVVRGDQWRAEGHVLRWSDWARMLGLRTCYRLTRISGRFRSAQMARRGGNTIIDLGGEETWLWTRLEAHGYKLPGVEAVWGGGAYVAPVDGVVFELWVTPGGYVIKKRKG